MNEAKTRDEHFDLEKYLRNAGATRPDSFDWSDPGPRLEDEALFCVGYMMDIESHTVIYMKELLSTSVARIHRSPHSSHAGCTRSFFIRRCSSGSSSRRA